MMDTIDRVETDDAFADWLQIAKPGEVCVYHVGHLAEQRLTDSQLHKLGLAVLRAAGYRHIVRRGHDRSDTYSYEGPATVALVQKRCAKGFEYRAVRR